MAFVDTGDTVRPQTGLFRRLKARPKTKSKMSCIPRLHIYPSDCTGQPFHPGSEGFGGVSGETDGERVGRGTSLER